MLRHLIAVLGLLLGVSAWSQPAPPGTYVFVSGPGVGTPPFTVSGFGTSLGGSIVGAHVPFCSGTHVHGTFNGFADPASGGCGHGIIALFVAPPPVSGGGLPGGHPTNVAGQLALAATFPALTGRLYGDPAAALAFAPSLTDPLGANRLVLLSSLNDGSFALPQAMPLQSPAGSSAGDIPPGSTGPALAADVLRTTLADPAQRVLTSPATTSWLEDFAAYDDLSAEGYRRDAEKTAQQADAWRELADDARRDAARNRQRADDARRDGRERDARDWDEEARRDDANAEDRDREAERLDGWSEEASRREDAAREQARERRAAAERAREQARQAERDRAERVRQQAEEKARIAREEREARRAKEQAEREARLEEQRERWREHDRRVARQRAEAEREHRRWLEEQQRNRDARARGSSSDADLAAAAARRKKNEEEEEKTWADYVVEYADSAAEWVKDKLKDKLKDEVMERTGITDKIDDLGLDKAAGAIGEGLEQIEAVKKLGESMEAELQRQPGLRRRIEDRLDTFSDSKSPTQRSSTLSSGSLYGKEMFGTVSRMVEANR